MITISSILINGLQVKLTLSRAIANGETGTVQYIPGVNKLQGVNGAKVAAFTEDVTNNVVSV